MTAREVLDGIRGRLTAARVCTYCMEPEGQKHKGFCLTRMEGARAEHVTNVAADPTDVARLVAAVEGALGLCDDPGGPDSWTHTFNGRPAIYVDDVRAAVEAALKEGE